MNPQLANKICEEISSLPRMKRNLISLGKKDENHKKYTDLLSKLEKQWGDKYSRKYIEKIVKSLINKFASDENEALKSELQEEDLKYKQYDIEQAVYIPVDGIRVDSSFSIEIGKVTFVRISSKELKNLLDSMAFTVETMQYSDEEKMMILAERDKYMEEHFLHKVCSKMSIVAEPEKAYEITVIETNKAFEILRYSIPCFNYIFDMSKRVEIGFLGSVSLGRKTGLSISTSGFYDMWRMSQEPLSLAANFQEKFNQIGLSDLSIILKKTSRTEVEEMILRFLHWISDSYIQIELENRLLSLIISLETLFGSGAHATGFGCAMLLGEDLEQRRNIKNRVAELYKHRNNVAHGSRKNKVEDKDVSYLILLTMELMIRMLKLVKSGAVFSKKDLQKIIEEKQLS